MARIELKHVGLTFRVREQFQITLKEFLLRGMFRRNKNPVLKVRALRDINLRLADGDRLGIIGGNGAGKSTLLRLLAGVYAPTHGRRIIQGRVSSLFELGLGFEMESSGRQNIFYRGYLLGESPRTMRAKMEEIADFCELGRFLDIPMRFYSAGMLVRLAFAIATTLEPEILLVDEVLSAGDAAFQEKAGKRMRDMLSRARIIVIVSHDLDTLARTCDSGLWMDKGRVRLLGPMEDVLAAYRNHAREQRQPAAPALEELAQERRSAGAPC